MLHLKYEALVQDPASALHRLAEFLGTATIPMEALVEAPTSTIAWNNVLPPEQEPELRYGKHHASLRSWQFNQPFFDGSNQWQDGLSAAEKTVVCEIAGGRLIELGYASSLCWAAPQQPLQQESR